MTVIPLVIDTLGTRAKGAGRIENRRTSLNNKNYCIVEVSQNTEKNPEYLRRLAVTQTSVTNLSANGNGKNHKE